MWCLVVKYQRIMLLLPFHNGKISFSGPMEITEDELKKSKECNESFF
jgi:hypothetical protein